MIYRFLKLPDLIQECIANNDQAWSEFINRYNSVVLRTIKFRLYSYNMAISHSEISDIKQSFFLKLWKNQSLEKVKNSANIHAWISMVTDNFTRDHIKSLKKDPIRNSLSLIDEFEDQPEGTFCLKENIRSKFISADIKIDSDLIHTTFLKLLDTFSSKEKIAINLLIFHDMKYREITKITGVPKSTLSNIMIRIREDLHQHLKENF
ncbi:MAG: sigma-70 family RNA polymerase sigma factor [Candidatus Omnitrophica bacterium]|nr:sigma-70 family RNA polymerase sigma factor [Candidatus Omnitrophota bacterium]